MREPSAAAKRLRQAATLALAALFLGGPCLLKPSVPLFIGRGLFLTILLWEWMAPRRPSSFFSDDGLRSVIYSLLKTASGVVPSFLTALLIRPYVAWAPWSLARHHAPIWVQAVAGFLALDLMMYWIHRAQHRFIWWWNFHKPHHATREVSAFAFGPSHVLDVAVVQLVLRGFAVAFLGLQPLAYLWGHAFLASWIGTAFIHANVEFPKHRMGWLSRIFNTPRLHADHHANDGDQSNFGEILALWDRIFGTYRDPFTRPEPVFGLRDEPEYMALGIAGELVYPFVVHSPQGPKAQANEDVRRSA
jgi:sterol desaturase/sphingolipid hydroxylase (fatty acid hydroxylase superfamily)